MVGFDRDFWGHATLAAVFILGMGALIACVLVLGLVLLQSWEAEWLLRCSSLSFSPSLSGWFLVETFQTQFCPGNCTRASGSSRVADFPDRHSLRDALLD
jgi:hypothetical protein